MCGTLHTFVNPGRGREPQAKFLFSGECKMPGYIYLIMMADGVYKVGRTQQDYDNHLKRLKSYPPDSQIVYVRKVQGDVVSIEGEIIGMFKKEFGKHIRGNEYFTGDENRMIELIHEVTTVNPVTRFDNHALKRFIKSDEVILDPSRSCPQRVFVSYFREWCRRNEIDPLRFNEDFYKGIFSQHDVEVRSEARVWRGVCYGTQPFVMGLDVKTDVERHVGNLRIDRPVHIEKIILDIENLMPGGLYVGKAEVIRELENKGYIVAPISGIVHPPPAP